MLVGIYDLKDHNGLDFSFLKDYERVLDRNGIAHIRLNFHDSDFWEKVSGLDLFIMRAMSYDSHHLITRDLLPVIEGEFGVKCYPNQRTYWHYDDKARQYLFLKRHNFPMAESHIFYDRNRALKWMENCEIPTVFKLRNGAGSHNVILIKSRGQGERLIKRMFGKGITPSRFHSSGNIRFQHFSLYSELHHFAGNLYRWSRGVDTSPQWKMQKNYVLFQKFLPGNSFDTRVTVIGDRAFAFRRMTRKGDFRASGSGMIDHDVSKVDMRCVEIAHRVSATCRFQSMAYDFLFNEKGEPEFAEISYDYLSSAVYKCPGYWDRGLNWHEGHFRPEVCHLVDALGLPDLKDFD
jgi:glutathione synthase/RimK-type ligase-like ATP-grasp enzyme